LLIFTEKNPGAEAWIALRKGGKEEEEELRKLKLNRERRELHREAPKGLFRLWDTQGLW
jgi:ferric-dicitrate binding protein FerR (iron transport regulator)